MNLASATQVRRLLEQRGLVPRKALGQNFLTDIHVRDIILDACGGSPCETILEVGAGLGMLTAGLIERGFRVIAIEKDTGLHEWLSESFSTQINDGALELIHADALSTDLPALVESGARRVVANLPYSVGNRILVNLATSRFPPDAMTLMVQQDVADRIMAPPGGGEYGALSVFSRLLYDIRVVKRVPPGCFVPRPRVQSTVLAFTRNQADVPSEDEMTRFISLTKTCFAHRRKQIQAILRHYAGTGRESLERLLAREGIAPADRPEAIAPGQWRNLAASL